MLDQPVPNPVAKNPNIHTHKVLAAVGLILIGTILILSGLAFVYRDQLGDFLKGVSTDENDIQVTRTATKSSTPKATESSKKDKTEGWKIYTSTKGRFSIKYPEDWSIWSYGRGVSVEYFQVNSKDDSYQEREDIPQAHVWVDVFTEDYKKTISEGTEYYLNGVKGLYSGRLTSCNVGCYVISAKIDSTVYEIAMSVSTSTKNPANSSAYADFEEIFLTIAKTFKFL